MKKRFNLKNRIWPWSEIHRLKSELSSRQSTIKDLVTTNMHLMKSVDEQYLKLHRVEYEVVSLCDKIFIEPEAQINRADMLKRSYDNICKEARKFISNDSFIRSDGIEEVNLRLLVSKRNTNN